ncbi:RNA exonuclease 5 [Astyanax mexicanus]|uniref:RNA exonuclease 5 n=1 Tax=Astyanax mexicanus TaxID=7994 RepID=UPI0020CB2584|nr:RNA exonuclease 5 [Astyanax mexicanus]XP_049325299.1 RNA exonuclease 5 [Astyanax mexicanus]
MSRAVGSKRKLGGSAESSPAQKRLKAGEEPQENQAAEGGTDMQTNQNQAEPDLSVSQQHQHRPHLSRPSLQQRQPITVEDVCRLVQYSLLGTSYGSQKPSWCRLRGRRRVVRVNVAVLEGLTQLHFYSHYSQFNQLRTKYSTRCTLAPSSGHLLSELLTAELPNPQSSPAAHTAPPTAQVAYHPVVRRFGLKKSGMSSYLLKEEEMIKKSFPIKGGRGCEAFACTRSADHVTDSSPLFGLDCEMCITKAGTELTRVALVDSRGRCLLDELVKPFNPIINYCTRFSGITRSMLQDVETRLQDVQVKLVDLLPPDAVLVGHSLDNDLRVLNLVHPHVIDTSLLYRKEFGQRFKLKHLALIILRREIQSEERKGHDPCEDARAALELAQYFISKGPKQVVETHLEDLWDISPAVQPSAVNGPLTNGPLTNGPLTNGSLPINRLSPLRFCYALHKSGQSALFLGRSETMGGNRSSQMWRRHHCSTDKQVVSVAERVGGAYALSVLQFSSYTDILNHSPEGGSTPHLKQMADRLRKMCVLFVGPLPWEHTEENVHTLLRCYGKLRSVRLLRKTHSMYAVVEFQHLEGAQLALQNRLQINNQTIKVQRPVSELTLDLEASLAELQDDVLNDHVIYVGGLSSRHHHPDDLLHTFSQFGPIRDIITPPKNSGKLRRHAHIRFLSADSVPAAVGSPVQVGNRTLNVCRALTPPHMHTWTHTCPVTMETSGETPVPEEQRGEGLEITAGPTCPQDGVVERGMRTLDRTVGKMFSALEENTLSIVIMPGVRSGGVEYSGLCFLEVKQR